MSKLTYQVTLFHHVDGLLYPDKGLHSKKPGEGFDCGPRENVP